MRKPQACMRKERALAWESATSSQSLQQMKMKDLHFCRLLHSSCTSAPARQPSSHAHPETNSHFCSSQSRMHLRTPCLSNLKKPHKEPPPARFMQQMSL